MIAKELRLSYAHGGRSVFGWEAASEALDDERKPNWRSIVDKFD